MGPQNSGGGMMTSDVKYTKEERGMWGLGGISEDNWVEGACCSLGFSCFGGVGTLFVSRLGVSVTLFFFWVFETSSVFG